MVLVVAFFVLCFFWNADGHARLTAPHPWGQEESQIAPCGEETLTGHENASAYWAVNTQAILGWYIESADGYGNVTLRIDTTGNINNFGNPLASTVWSFNFPNSTNSIGDFSLNFSVPNLTCTGTGNICVIQAISSSGWVDCATVTIGQNGSSMNLNPFGPGSCALAFSSICNLGDGGTSVVLDNETVSDLAISVTDNLAYLDDPLVFGSPNTVGCNTSFTAYICASTYLPCGNPKSCRNSCTQALCLCNVTEEHKDQYPCGTLTSGSDSYGACSTSYAPPGSSCHSGAQSIAPTALWALISLLASLIIKNP